VKRRRILVPLVLGLYLAVAATPRAAVAENWLTRGSSEDRPQSTAEKLGAIGISDTWTIPDTGTTGSQPLRIGDRIFHLAGNTLWEISPVGGTKVLVSHINMVLNDNNIPVLRPSTSGVTYVEVGGVPVLFYGTGDNQVCALRLDNTGGRCYSLTARKYDEEPIVTVPLVFVVQQHGRDVDLVVMGDKRGRLWIVQGLAVATSSDDVVAHAEYVGGWVLASPVKASSTPPAFIWATDRGNDGAIGGYEISAGIDGQPPNLRKLWGDVDTETGVADGFVREGRFVYASDKRGNFYRVDVNTGTKMVFPYADIGGPMFANAAPAVDDTYVYFSIRNVGTTNPNRTDPGRIVALNKEKFSLEGKPTEGYPKGWVANLTAPANTNPLVWTQGPNVVLVGDTKGVLHSFNRWTGASTDFAVQAAGQTSLGRDICTGMSTLDLGTPEQVGLDYQTLTGISEPIIASGSNGQGLLLVGVSGRDGDGKPIGSLKAFKASGAYNIAWAPPAPQQVTLAVGQPYQAKGDLTMTTWGGIDARTRMVGLQAYWVPSPEDLAAGAKVRLVQQLNGVTVDTTTVTPISINFTPIEADGVAGSLQLFINPEQLMFAKTDPGATLRRAMSLSETQQADLYRAENTQPLIEYIAKAQLPGNCDKAETELLPGGWDDATIDNVLTVPVAIEQVVDLSVHTLRSPGTVSCDTAGGFNASFMINNPSGRTLKGVPYALKVTSGKTGTERIFRRGAIDLGPGDTPVSAKVGLTGCGDTLALRAEANLGPEPRPVREPDYSNNAAEASVRVDEYVAPDIDFSTGNGDQIIVPADCVSNPDLTSIQPCLNYPNLLIP